MKSYWRWDYINPLWASTRHKSCYCLTQIVSPPHLKFNFRPSVQFSSVTQLCLTLCNPMSCSTPGLPVHHQLPEFTHDLGSSSFSMLSFCLFILIMGFSRQEYWSGLPFPSPVDHILSDLSTMTRPSRVALQAWLGFMRFVTLYRRQGSRPSPWKRNAKKKNDCLGRPYK